MKGALKGLKRVSPPPRSLASVIPSPGRRSSSLPYLDLVGWETDCLPPRTTLHLAQRWIGAYWGQRFAVTLRHMVQDEIPEGSAT